MTKGIPSVFVSHGAPTLILEAGPARDFLAGLGAALGKPRAVLCVSAHWETAAATISAAVGPETIHDFHGFPQEMYEIRYPAPGAPDLASAVAARLRAAGLPASVDPHRGFDHGAWVPLKLMYPDADVPAAQLSIQHHLGPGHHFAVGRALAGLGEDGVLVLGSGGATHNLRELNWGGGAEPSAWAKCFDDWLEENIVAGDRTALIDYRKRAPDALRAHPRDEHLLPLFVAFGAGGSGAKGHRLHGSFNFGSLSLAAYAFDPPGK